MGSIVYVSNKSGRALAIDLVKQGPTHSYDGSFHLKTGTVQGGASHVEVLEIDRGWSFSVGNAIDTVELTMKVDDLFVGAIVLLIDGQKQPIKNRINWGLRGAGEDLTAFVNDQSTQSLHYTTPHYEVAVSITGDASFLQLDDILVTVEAVPKWSKILTQRDYHLDRTVLFATNDLGDGTLQFSRDPEANDWKEGKLDLPINDPLLSEIFIVGQLFRGGPPLWVGGMTREGSLWLQRSDRSASVLIDLEHAGAAKGTLVVSDAFMLGGRLTAELWLTVPTPNGKFELNYRKIVLNDHPSFGSGWANWGEITVSRPAYASGRNGRNVWAGMKPLVGNPRIYYCAAGLASDAWGRWTQLAALPGNAVPEAVAGVAWSDDAMVPQDLGVVAIGSDRAVYAMSDTSNSWQRIAIEADARKSINWLGGSNAIAVFVTGTNDAIFPLLYSVKENTLRQNPMIKPCFGNYGIGGIATHCIMILQAKGERRLQGHPIAYMY